MWSNARSEAALEARLPFPIIIRPIRRARRMRLRLDEGRRSADAHLPVADEPPGRAQMGDRASRVDRRADRTHGPGRPFAPGASIPVEGEDRRSLRSQASRQVALQAGNCHCRRARAGAGRGALNLPQGARARNHVARGGRILRTGRRHARSVRVGDAKSRWGSCSSDGRIRLQLAADPGAARSAPCSWSRMKSRTSVHLDHSPAFKALEAELVGPGVSRSAARRSGG